MTTPQPPNLEKLRERRKVPLEGLAWLAFVLLTLFFGVFMTFKAYSANENLVEPAQASTGEIRHRDEAAI